MGYSQQPQCNRALISVGHQLLYGSADSFLEFSFPMPATPRSFYTAAASFKPWCSQVCSIRVDRLIGGDVCLNGVQLVVKRFLTASWCLLLAIDFKSGNLDSKFEIVWCKFPRTISKSLPFRSQAVQPSCNVHVADQNLDLFLHYPTI